MREFDDIQQEDNRPRRRKRRQEEEVVINNGTNPLLVIGVIAACVTAGGVVLTIVFCAGALSNPAPFNNSKHPDTMPLKTYVATKPPGDHTFTLECEISDYLLGIRDADERKHYLSVRMRSRSPFETAKGYVKKDSELGKRLYAILKDGHTHVLTVVVRQDDLMDSSSVLIVGLKD